MSRCPLFAAPLLIAWMVASLVPCVVGAQTAGGTDAPEPSAFSFRGGPGDRTRWFLLTELGVQGQLGMDGGGYYHPGDSRATLALGAMKNVSRRDAFGGTVLGMWSGDEFFRVGILPRYRRWLSNAFALDVSAGPLFYPVTNDYEAKGPGFYGGVSLAWAELVSLDLSMETFHAEHSSYEGTDQGTWVFLGVSGRSYMFGLVPLGIFLLSLAGW